MTAGFFYWVRQAWVTVKPAILPLKHLPATLASSINFFRGDFCMSALSQQWTEKLAAWRRSGLSMAARCRQNDAGYWEVG